MLTRVFPYELDAEMLSHFDRAIETDEHCGGIELVVRGIYDHHLQMWTWITDQCRMVIITEIIHQPDGYRELLVRMLAGTGGIQDWQDCTDAFAQICPNEEIQCERVIAYIKTALWKRFKKEGVGDGVQELYVVIGKEPK